MSKDFIVKKCKSCGALVRVLEDCNCDSNCGIMCCGEKMEVVKANVVDAAREKHIPNYEIIDGKLIVTVNHVMEDEHYIEWIAIVGDNFDKIQHFKPGDEPKACCKYSPNLKIYAWCNKHLLWVKDVD